MRLRLLALLTTLCLVAAGTTLAPASAADPMVTISGTVLGDDGFPLPGVAVDASLDDAVAPRYDASTTTGPDGTYSLTVVASGRGNYDLTYNKAGRWIPLLWGAQVRGASVTDVNVQLQRYGTISGGVTSPDGPVEGVFVDLRETGGSERSDAQGRYVLNDVLPGRYWINFRSEEKFDRPYYGTDDGQIEYIEVQSGEDVQLRTVGPLPRPPTGTLIVDTTGTRRPYPNVLALGVDGFSLATQQLYNPEHTVATLENVRPGQYKLAISGTTTWFGGLSLGSATPVTVTAGQTTHIAAQPGNGAVAQGTIVDPAGDGLTGLTVELMRSDSPGEVIADLVTLGGRFYVDDLPDADYVIRVSDPRGDYATQTFDLLTDPEREDPYPLIRRTPLGPKYPGPATASVSGTYTGYRNPGPVCFVPTSGRRGDEVTCSEWDGDTHRYEIPQIKPGDYKVRAGDLEVDTTEILTWLGGRSYASATTVTLSAGEHREVDVPGRPDSGWLLGGLSGRQGVPVPPLTVRAFAADNPDEVVVSEVAGSSLTGPIRWSMYRLPVRPYKFQVVDPTGRYESTWLGGTSFDTATTVTPLIEGQTYLPDVTLTPRLGALAPPIISGQPQVGATLSATQGFWSLPGLSFSYQWLRNGSPIAGATATTYRLTTADVGRRLSVRVTGRGDSGQAETTSAASGTITAEPTPRPAPTATATRAKPSVRTKVTLLGGRKVRLTVAYSAPGAVPTGRVTIIRGGKTVASGRQLRNGTVTVTLKNQPKGRVRYTVRYAGSDTVKPDSRQTKRVRVR